MTPVDAPTVRIPDVPGLVHVPPLVASLRVMLVPGHTVNGPVIPGGVGLTVNKVVAIHPAPGTVYVIMAVPAEIPFMVPPPAVATEVLLLDQVPPDVASRSVLVAPSHALVVPVIDAGRGVTVIDVEVEQPVPNV